VLRRAEPGYDAGVLYSDLYAMVGQLRYKPGWQFRLESGYTSSTGAGCPSVLPAVSAGTGMAFTYPPQPLFLVVCVEALDSTGSGQRIFLEHRFPVAPEELAMRWHRWLLDRILDVERHEACEFFRIGGERPFYPEHGPDADLYGITERSASA
jgi:hypothetical protein